MHFLRQVNSGLQLMKFDKYIKSFSYKYTIVLIMLMVVFQLSDLKSQTMDEDIGNFQVGFSANVFRGVYLKDATAAAKVLTEFFLKKYKRTWEVKPHEVFSSIEELKKILREQEFEVLVMHPSEYIQVKDLNLLEPIAVSVRNGSPYDSYYLLVHKDNNLKKLQGLKGKTILMGSLEGNKSELWLDYVLKQNKLSNKEKFFAQIKYHDNPLSTILPVFFKKEDACIVEVSSYNTVVELNPQIGQDLVTIEISQPLAIGLVAIRKSISYPQVKAEIKEAFLDLHKYEESRQYLTIFRIGKVVEFKEEYLKSTYELLGTKNEIHFKQVNNQ
jgi:phosphonate transport system substrate-binding protein